MEVQAGAARRSGNKREVLPTSAAQRLLSNLVWIELVMCRPRLVPVADPAGVLRHVEALAGHIADLLAGDGRGLPPDNSVVVTAREILDVCCEFIEQWDGGQATHSAAFEAEVSRLRTRSIEMMKWLTGESVVVQDKAS
ncbi:hypothetical protein [Actinocrispum sp. NPDC049592]|uniref:hypothetical protein n=1 Tax=Actinocrispum sp. NPDC049592 TaxID=3154835 RepID=UPI00343B7703